MLPIERAISQNFYIGVKSFSYILFLRFCYLYQELVNCPVWILQLHCYSMLKCIEIFSNAFSKETKITVVLVLEAMNLGTLLLKLVVPMVLKIF